MRWRDFQVIQGKDAGTSASLSVSVTSEDKGGEGINLQLKDIAVGYLVVAVKRPQQ